MGVPPHRRTAADSRRNGIAAQSDRHVLIAMLFSSHEQTLRRLRSLCLSLPETREVSSWGHPNFKAGKKTFVAFERVKGRPSIAFRLEPDEVDRLLQRKHFFVTPYGR